MSAPPPTSANESCVHSFEQHLEQEQRALQQQRRRLYNEVAEEKERLGQQAARYCGAGSSPAQPSPALPCPASSSLPGLTPAHLQAAGRAG